MRSVLFLLAAVLTAACSAPYLTGSEGDGYVIRYVNMNTIYDYELSRSNEAVALRAKREDLLKKVSAAESAGREEGGRELEHYRSELQKVEEGQKKLKAAIFAKIKRAVESVAGRYEVDFILGAGEGVVYSRPVFDLTDDVIDELEKMNKNSSPVWK